MPISNKVFFGGSAASSSRLHCDHKPSIDSSNIDNFVVKKPIVLLYAFKSLLECPGRRAALNLEALCTPGAGAFTSNSAGRKSRQQ